jgi:hypothetical protein
VTTDERPFLPRRRRLDHARQYVDRCRRELARFDQHAGAFDIIADGPRKRLERDLREAEITISHCGTT